MDIHTQPEAKDSAVSHFQVLMFHQIIKKNLTHRGKAKYNKNNNYPQRKIVQKHRNSFIGQRSQFRWEKNKRKKTDGSKHSTEHRAVQHISSRHGPSLTQGINATHFMKHRFCSQRESTIKTPWQQFVLSGKTLHANRQGTDIIRQTKLQSLNWCTETLRKWHCALVSLLKTELGLSDRMIWFLQVILLLYFNILHKVTSIKLQFISVQRYYFSTFWLDSAVL